MESLRMIAVHDLSGFGRSSLTTAIPIISTFGIQVCPVPTALLSTITGFYTGYTRTDCTQEMNGCIDHWASLRLSFDCIYSGYLGSAAQIESVKRMIDTFRPRLKVIDPVCGDGGSLYAEFDLSFVDAMRDLIAYADVITPNLTEAAFLLRRPIEECASREDASEWLHALSDFGPHTVIITGMPLSEHEMTTALYLRESDSLYFYTNPKSSVPFPGTGDTFTSVLTGALLSGMPHPEAAQKAVNFVDACIRKAEQEQLPPKEGLPIEPLLYLLQGENR